MDAVRTPSIHKDLAPHTVRFSAHGGTSMNPTLCALDLLEIMPYGERPVRVGDVIFFLQPQGNNYVVHRVVSVTSEGIRTRGDNNNRRDPWLIRPEDVLGQVVRARRGKKRRVIYGGSAGWLLFQGLKGFKALEHCLSFFYHRLARSGLCRKLMTIQKQIRIVAINRAGGRSFKLLLGNWLIGHYEPGMSCWQIVRPFRLFVDQESLPR